LSTHANDIILAVSTEVQMAKRLWIVQGDTTSHGGVVLGGDPDFSIQGHAVARIGDPVWCPVCKNTFPIVQGRPTVTSHGPNQVHEGMMTGCGAILIGGKQTISFWDDGGKGDAVNPPKLATPEHPHDRYFQVVDEHGSPISQFDIHLTAPNGSAKKLKTDSSGKSPLVSGNDGEHASLTLFKKGI